VVIVGSDGNIRWIDVHPGYAPRIEVAQILAVLVIGDMRAANS
jgi:hypothetical protein